MQLVAAHVADRQAIATMRLRRVQIAIRLRRAQCCHLIAVVVAVALLAVSCGRSESEGATNDVAAESSAITGVPTTSSEAALTPAPTTPAEPETTTPAEPESTALAEPEPSVGAAPELAAIDPIGTGPYGVGVQTITIVDESRNRPLTVDVWFPLIDATRADPARYTFITGDYFESPRALDASVDSASTDGPFPLVLYSHGSGGSRYIHSDYTETIASHGYVVAAPDHTGNTSVEQVLGISDRPAVVAFNRPLDMAAVLDALVAGTGEAADYTALIDPDRVAATGHSFGGFTTYAMASGYENDLGSVPPDPRIDALIPLAPAVGDGGAQSLLTTERLGSIELPTMIIVGTDDKTTPVDPNVETAWQASNATPHYRVELVAAEHQTFTDLCDYLLVVPQRPGANPQVVETITTMGAEGCSPGDMPIERAKELTNTFAVTFLDSIFRDAEMFAADTHQIPDDVLFDVER